MKLFVGGALDLKSKGLVLNILPTPKKYVADPFDSPLIPKVFGDRLGQAGLAPRAVIGAVMRKLAHLIYGVIKSGKPFDMKKTMPMLDFQAGN